jgi:hypothetical protein
LKAPALALSRIPSVIVALALAAALSGCDGLGKQIAAGKLDEPQIEMKPPSLDGSTHYETASASIDIPVPAVAFARWFEQTGAPILGSFLSGAATVPAVVRSEPLIGSWHEPGDRRRLVFADGASALEQILDKSPRLLRVELWNLKNDTGRYFSYALEEFTISEVAAGGTRFTWKTDFEPKFQPPDGWMIRSYVQEDYRRFMETGLSAMAERATDDLNPERRTK